MTKNDGYQDYLDRSAGAYNSIGAAHHDPAVRARQAMQTGIYPQSAGQADIGLGIVALLVALPIVFPAVAFYRGFVETLTGWRFAHMREGLLFDNQIVDGIVIVALVLASSYLVARFAGYFFVVGIVSLFCWSAREPVSAYAFVFGIYLYWLLRYLGTRKFVWPIHVSLVVTAAAMLVSGEFLGSGFVYSMSVGVLYNHGVQTVVVYFIISGLLWGLYRAGRWVIDLFRKV